MTARIWIVPSHKFLPGEIFKIRDAENELRRLEAHRQALYAQLETNTFALHAAGDDVRARTTELAPFTHKEIQND